MNPQPPEGFDYFELFGLEPAYDIDEGVLHGKYLLLARSVHPDVVGKASDEMRRRSLSLSSQLNRAYDTLRDPVARAAYLLAQVAGPAAAGDRAVPGEVLDEVMMLREEIEEAQAARDTAALEALRRKITARRQSALEMIAGLSRSLAEDNSETQKDLRKQLNAIKYWSNLLDQLPPGGDV